MDQQPVGRSTASTLAEQLSLLSQEEQQRLLQRLRALPG